MKSPNGDVAKQSICKYFLLVSGFLWNCNIGLFLAGVGMSLGGLKIAIINLLIGLLIMVIYSAGIYWFRHKIIWFAIGTTIFIGLAAILLNSVSVLDGYIITMTLSINFLLLGKLGLQLLKSTKNRSMYWNLIGLFVGSLSFGWILGILTFPS